MMTDISENLGAFIWFLYIFAAMLLLIVLIVLSVVFSITVNERKKELSVIRALGASKRYILSVIFKETLIVSISGGLAGTILSSILIFPFSTYISDSIGLPYLQPGVGAVILILAVSLLISIAVGPAAAINSAVKISKLVQLGIGELSDCYPKSLSGGERRRAVIARALINSPKIIIADEPTSDLDRKNTKEVIEIFKNIAAQGTAVIMVTHENDTKSYSDFVYELNEGTLREVFGNKLKL